MTELILNHVGIYILNVQIWVKPFTRSNFSSKISSVCSFMSEDVPKYFSNLCSLPESSIWENTEQHRGKAGFFLLSCDCIRLCYQLIFVPVSATPQKNPTPNTSVEQQRNCLNSLIATVSCRSILMHIVTADFIHTLWTQRASSVFHFQLKQPLEKIFIFNGSQKELKITMQLSLGKGINFGCNQYIKSLLISGTLTQPHSDRIQPQTTYSSLKIIQHFYFLKESRISWGKSKFNLQKQTVKLKWQKSNLLASTP